MGCKCTRDFFFGESEIIRAHSINPKMSKKMNEKPLSKSKYLSYKKTSSFIKSPEVSIIPKEKEETASAFNPNGTQASFYNFTIKDDTINPTIPMVDNNNDDYDHKIISIINNIRADPVSYANVVKESIKNIKRTKHNKIIYHNNGKVALFRGEEAFLEAEEKLRNTQPMNALEFDPNLCIPLPENEEEFKSQELFNSNVEKMREKNINVEIYYRDLIKIPEVAVLLMIVDDNSKNVTKKRNTLLNKNFRYIGICSKFIGKHFVAHFSFSR